MIRPVPSLTAVLHEAVKDAPSGLTAASIAELAGRDYSTLMSELSRQRGHKLGADLVLPLMLLTGSAAPMNFLASQLGGAFVHIPAEAGQNELTDSLIASIREFADFSAQTADSLRDGIISQTDYNRICKEGQEAASAILHVMELARKAYEQHYGEPHDDAGRP